jgi:AAHS family 4-hydroxybenzoate transporter-like MFS transporter
VSALFVAAQGSRSRAPWDDGETVRPIPFRHRAIKTDASAVCTSHQLTCYNGGMKKIDVNQVLDTAGLFGLPLVVILCTTIILILDGLDIQIISLAAPLLALEFRVTPASLGPVLAAAIVGMAAGGFAFGALGDRQGRRPVLLASVAIFGLSTLLGVTSHSMSALAAWRFLTGIGLGGAIPNAMALLAEFTGPRWRTHAIAAAVVGVPIGGMSGAVIASHILQDHGWRSMFVVGGLLPCAFAVLLFFALPESPRYLATRLNRRDSLVKVLNRLVGNDRYTAVDEFDLGDLTDRSNRTRVSLLLAPPLLTETLGLWLIFFTNMFTIYTFFSWTPVILRSLGLPLAAAVHGSVTFNVAGICGGVLTAWVLNRWGSRRPLAALGILGMGALLLISRLLTDSAGDGPPLNQSTLMAEIAVVGFVMIGIQTAAYRLSTHLYPTHIRSSGVGWAAGFGRLGGISSSLVAGWLLAQIQGAGLFAALAGMAAATLIGALMIRRHLAAVV